MKRINYSIIIIVTGAIVAELIIWGEGNMDAGTISILVALIALIGSIWCQIIQFRKDAQRIDNVNNTSASVKQDTSKMEPAVARIVTNTTEIEHQMLGMVLPHITYCNEKMEEIKGGLGTLVKNADVDKEIRNRVSVAATDPRFIKGAVDVIYAENAQLRRDLQEEQQKSQVLRYEIMKLKEENRLLQNKVKETSWDLEDEEYEIE